MSRNFGMALLACVLFAGSVQAEEYAGAKIVNMARGTIAFEHEGKNRRVPVSVSLKILDDKGEVQDPVTGTRFLQPGNIVDIKVEANRQTKRPQIVEVRFVSGKVAEMPKSEKLDLRPNPEYKGTLIEAATRDPYLMKYIPQAKVGDFVEYHRGNAKDAGREEVMEVGKDYVIVAKVFYILGSRQEDRRKMKLPPPGTSASSGGLPGRRSSRAGDETEEVEVAGKKLQCVVEKNRGQPFRWKSAEVPLDGVVKYLSRNVQYHLTDFGRGK